MSLLDMFPSAALGEGNGAARHAGLCILEGNGLWHEAAHDSLG